MRKQKLFLLLVLFLFTGNLSAQSGWVQTSTYVPLRFSSCQYTSDDTAYLAGGFNMLLKTTDNGNSWTRKKASNLPTNAQNTTFLTFKNSNVGFMLASYFGIVRTTDGGDTFSMIYNGSAETMFFINENTGFITDLFTKKLVKTSNGGQNWITILDTCNISLKLFINETTGIAVNKITYQTVRTTNGGSNWSMVLTNGLEYCAAMPNGNLIASVGTDIWKSTNAGLNWSMIYDYNFPLYNVFIISNNKIIVKAGSTKLLVSTNSGNSWELKTSPTNTPFVNLSFNSLGEGMFANTDGDILKMTSDFKTVNSLIADSIRKVTDLEIAGNSKIFLIGDQQSISSSVNNGTTFLKNNLPFNLRSISFNNPNTGYGTHNNKILKTTDAGLSWDTIYKSLTVNQLSDINFLNENTGYMYKNYYSGAYSYDTLCFTTNGGVSWTPTQLSNYIYSFYEYSERKYVSNLQLFPNGTGYFNYTYSIRSQTAESLFVGLYRTSDFGRTFEHISPDAPIWSINFINENTGFGRAGNYNIYKTTNRGTNWLQTGTIPNYLIQNLLRQTLFVNANTGFALTAFRTLMIIGKTTDGGVTWSDKRIELENASATNIKFYGEQLGFIYDGETGQIFRTTDGGSTFVNHTSSEISEQFLLKQNYPNPFNPSTKINYKIKSPGLVKLKVFDLLGKEIATLVNEKQNAGSYTVEFNSTEFNLPSGVYFYTLKTDGFTETKKMVLVK